MPTEGETVRVQKLGYDGQVVYAWSGGLERVGDAFVVHARFPVIGKEPPVVDGVPLNNGDIFTEFYYPDRWYNVFHITDPSGRHKGWYCNVAQPATLGEEGIAFIDMALDLFVHPDGHYTVLDEDEFAEAAGALYSAEDIRSARAGLDDLIRLAEARELPAPELPVADPPVHGG
jgi:protein associated with RNAse G/E